MASTGDESKPPSAKRARHDGAQAAPPLPPPPPPPPPRVQLNPADCNLDFAVSHGGLRGHALHEGGFAYCWSGARATAGVRGGGRYCFGCTVLAEQPVEMEDTDAGQRHLCRVGVSRGDDPVGGLGEAGGQSFAIGGSGGKPRHDGNLIDDEFGVGDTIVCAVDLDAWPMASIRFSKNGQWLGIALPLDASQTGLGLAGAPVRPMPWESAIFPHVLLKNVIVDMQFSMEDGLEPVNGYQPWSSLLACGNAVLGPAFAEQRDCEILVMVGLPASGKTTWAENCAREHRERRFVIIGINHALEQMKMTGLLSERKIPDALFDRWMDRATRVAQGLLGIAENVPRNYILDQANVERIPRIRLLSRFSNFGRKIAVVVFPSPAELQSRSRKQFRQTWKQVSDEEVNKMSANFALPLLKNMHGSMEPFDEVFFVELSQDDAERYLNPVRSNRGSNAIDVIKEDLALRRRQQGIGATVQYLRETEADWRLHQQVQVAAGTSEAPRNLVAVSGCSINALPLYILEDILMKINSASIRNAVSSSFVFVRAAMFPCECDAFRESSSFIAGIVQPSHGRPSVAAPERDSHHPLSSAAIMLDRFLRVRYNAQQWYRIVDSRKGYLLIQRNHNANQFDVMRPFLTTRVVTLPLIDLRQQEEVITATIVAEASPRFVVMMLSREGLDVTLREFRSRRGVWIQQRVQCSLLFAALPESRRLPLYASDKLYLLDAPQQRVLCFSREQNFLDSICLPASVDGACVKTSTLSKTRDGQVCWVALDHSGVTIFAFDGAAWRKKRRWPVPQHFYSSRLIGFAADSEQVMVGCFEEVCCIDIEEGVTTYLKGAPAADSCVAFEMDHIVADHE